MDVELELVAQVWAALMVVNVIVAAVAWFAARPRGRSPALAALCALLLGLVPPLNIVYLAILSLLPVPAAR